MKFGQMKLGRMNHIGVATPDLDAAIAFYRQVMGANDITEPFGLGPSGINRLREVGGQRNAVAKQHPYGLDLGPCVLEAQNGVAQFCAALTDCCRDVLGRRVVPHAGVGLGKVGAGFPLARDRVNNFAIPTAQRSPQPQIPILKRGEADIWV